MTASDQRDFQSQYVITDREDHESVNLSWRWLLKYMHVNNGGAVNREILVELKKEIAGQQ